MILKNGFWWRKRTQFLEDLIPWETRSFIKADMLLSIFFTSSAAFGSTAALLIAGGALVVILAGARATIEDVFEDLEVADYISFYW